MAASNNGRTEAVEQLVQLRADPNMQDHVRTKNNHCSMCEFCNYVGWLVGSAGISVQETRGYRSETDRGRSKSSLTEPGQFTFSFHGSLAQPLFP